MASLIQCSVDLSKVAEDVLKDGKYLQITIAVNDETQFNNNCGIFLSQSKEDREGGVAREYIGNGRVVWTDGKVTTAEPIEAVEKKPAPKAKKLPLAK